MGSCSSKHLLSTKYSRNTQLCINLPNCRQNPRSLHKVPYGSQDMWKSPCRKTHLWISLLLLKETWSSIAFQYRGWSKVKTGVIEYLFANMQTNLIVDNMQTGLVNFWFIIGIKYWCWTMVNTIFKHFHKTAPWRLSWIEQPCKCPIIVYMTCIRTCNLGQYFEISLFSVALVSVSVILFLPTLHVGTSCSLIILELLPYYRIVVVDFNYYNTHVMKSIFTVHGFVFFLFMVLALWSMLPATVWIELFWCLTWSGIFIPWYTVSFQHTTT